MNIHRPFRCLPFHDIISHCAWIIPPPVITWLAVWNRLDPMTIWSGSMVVSWSWPALRNFLSISVHCRTWNARKVELLNPYRCSSSSATWIKLRQNSPNSCCSNAIGATCLIVLTLQCFGVTQTSRQPSIEGTSAMHHILLGLENAMAAMTCFFDTYNNISICIYMYTVSWELYLNAMVIKWCIYLSSYLFLQAPTVGFGLLL